MCAEGSHPGGRRRFPDGSLCSGLRTPAGTSHDPETHCEGASTDPVYMSRKTRNFRIFLLIYTGSLYVGTHRRVRVLQSVGRPRHCRPCRAEVDGRRLVCRIPLLCLHHCTILLQHTHTHHTSRVMRHAPATQTRVTNVGLVGLPAPLACIIKHSYTSPHRTT